MGTRGRRSYSTKTFLLLYLRACFLSYTMYTTIHEPIKRFFHVYIYTHTPIHIHECIPKKNLPTLAGLRSQDLCSNICTHTHVYAGIHTHTHTYIHECIKQIFLPTVAELRSQDSYDYICTHIYICMYTYTHMYIYTLRHHKNVLTDNCRASFSIMAASNAVFADSSCSSRQTLCYSVLQRVAVCCSVLQRVAACCSVLQRVAAILIVASNVIFADFSCSSRQALS